MNSDYKMKMTYILKIMSHLIEVSRTLKSIFNNKIFFDKSN
jgi:hypothetical protein